MKTGCLGLLPAFGVIVSLTTGCMMPAGPHQHTAMIHDSLRTSPQSYRRVVIVPICCSASAYCDSSLTSNELVRIACEAGERVASGVARTFTEKGYQVTGEVRAVCSDDDLEAFDDETRELMRVVRAEFEKLTQRFRESAEPGVTNLVTEERLQSPLSRLQAKLGAPQADALVLVDSMASLETPASDRKRVIWNWTGAPLVTTAAFAVALGGWGLAGFPSGVAGIPPRTAIEHAIAIVDPHSQAVLWWSSTRAPGADARISGLVNGTVGNLLAELPEIPKETEGTQTDEPK